MPKWKADALIEKKKKEEEAKKTGASSKPQSSVSSVSKNSTFLGGGSSVKKTEERVKGPSEEKLKQVKANTTRRTQNTTAAQRQKMGVPTEQDLQSGHQHRQKLRTSVTNAVKQATSEDNKGFMQRQKSGTQTEADKRRTEQMTQRRTEVAKNTGAAAVKAVKDTVSGYGQSLADVDEMAKSNRNWTTAKAQKMGIDLNDRARVAKVEQERQQSIREAREFRQELFDKQEQRQTEWDERTKNAKGLEKAWYGAVESGTGMVADTLVGAATGTGQFGALASMGLRTYGPSANQARKEGATDKEARLYGLAQSGKEIATELMFQGAGLAKAAYGKTGLSLADKSANILTKGLTGIKADAVGAGVRALGGTAEENVEELAGWMADPLIKELTYGKAVRNRMKENLRANIPQIGSDADAANVASYFSTPQFTDELTSEYIRSGMSKDKASELAAEMRDYYVAYYSGDQGRLDALEEDLAAKLSGQDKLSLKSWSMDELKDTFASTTLLTLATGLPGAVTTSVKGNQIFDSDEVKAVFGNDAVRKVADAVKNTSNKEMSLKAETMKDRLDSGKDLTGTQKFDLYQGYLEKVNETAKKARASYGVAENAREEQNLVPTMGVDRAGNTVYAKATQQEYNEKFASTELTVEAIKNYMESDNSISDDEARRANAVKKAVADLHVGGLTVGDAHEFAYGNDLAREALKAEEGIDLDRYIVRRSDGTVDLAATNEATENALFQINADNAIKAAQAETEVFIDDTRGNIDKDLLTRFGNNGQAVWKEVNKGLDPRNLKNYLTTANAASYFYSAGRNTDMGVDAAINNYADLFKTVDNSVLKRAFAAGARDRIIANTPGYGQTVTSGSNIQLKKTKPIITGQLIMDKDVAIPDSDQSAYLALAMSTNTNIHIVSSLKSKQGVEINGMSHGNDIYLNMNAAAESNLGYVFMHEMTHQIKQYAPNEYLALENLVRDRWFNKDQKGMQKAIKDRIDLYSTKGGQQLTEEEAVEEIIADAMAEAMDDPDFAAEVCEQDINLGQAILDSIRAALRSIRKIFANSDFKNDRFHNSLLSYLGILDEAEKMWLNALATAKQNKADGLIADWQDRANKQNSPRLSVNEASNKTIETRFSMSEPVERVKDLIAVHNLKPDDIRNTFELGGFPMPSIAVTKDSMGHDMYGDITLMFHSDTIDPRKRRSNEVFGGDAYTPVFPRIHYKANSKVADKLSDLYYEWSRKYGYDMTRPFYSYGNTFDEELDNAGGEAGLKENAKSDSRLMRMFLQLNDKDVEDVIKTTEVTMAEGEVELSKKIIEALGEDAVKSIVPEDVTGLKILEYRRQWVEEHKDQLENVYRDYFASSGLFSEEQINDIIPEIKAGEYAKAVRTALDYIRHGATKTKEETDYAATTEAVKKAAKENGYDEWIDELFTGAEEKRGLRNDKDMFTASGNRRKWESLYEPVTLEGVVRVMSRELSAGANGLLGANPKGAAQKKYRSLDEIRADEDRLQMLPEEEYKKLDEEALDKFTAVCSSIYEHNVDKFHNTFGGMLDIGEAVAEILNETREKDGIKRILTKEYHWDVTDNEMDNLMGAIDAIASVPTGYFEAKPRRAVGFDEVQAAIIPNNLDEDIKTGLSDRGITTYEYDPEVEGDRTQKINDAASENDLRFSISAKYDDAYMSAVNSGNMDEAQRLVDEAARMAGMRVAHRYHGTMNANFTVFDKAYAKVGGNSGAGFYFSTEEDDSLNHYQDVEGADNYFKWHELAEAIWDTGELPDGTDIGDQIGSYEEAVQYAKDYLNKSPGTFDVYLNYKNPYIRDYKNSTNIYDALMDDFDESVINREDYEDEWEYEDALWEAKAEHLSEALYGAVYGAYQALENNYEVLDIPYIDNVLSQITEYAFDGELTWEEIESGITFAGEVEVTNPEWTDSGNAVPELTRAIIENLGFDAIEDKEVSQKFGQLSREMMTDTEHIIVFKPEQIKLSDPVTYAEDGSVIPLSERFDPTNNDIRYSLPTQDSDGNILTDGQMEYFKNSQARDIFGRLVPVYHATDMGGFTIFDPWKSDDHRSLFFSNRRDVANTYVERYLIAEEDRLGDEEGSDLEGYYQVYLNLENPLIIEGDGQPWNNIVNGGSVFPAYSSITLRNRSWFEDEAENRDKMYDLGQSLYNGDKARERAQEFEGDDYVEIEIFNGEKKIKAIIPLTEEAVAEEAAAAFGVEDLELLQGVASEIVGDMEFGNTTKIYDDDMRNTIGEYGYNTREWAEFAEDEGYDGVIFRNIIDLDNKTDIDEDEGLSDIYIAFSSNQVKDTRNVDPTENPDIRYSIATRDEVSGYLMQNAESITDIPLQDARLEENRIRYSLDATNFENSIIASWDRRKRNLAEEVQETPLKNELIRLMKQVRKGSGTDRKYSTETIEETIRSIKKMYYFAKGDKAKEYAREAWDAAERIVDDIDYNDELYKQYQGITDYFASYRINLSEDLFDAFGNYKNDEVKEDFEKFVKDNSGKIRFSWDRFSDASDIVELHYAYSKLSEEYPDLFPSDIDNPIDMLLQMDYVLNLTDPYRDAYTSEEHSKLVEDIANSLCNIVDEGNEYKATVDDLNVKAMKQRHREAILKVKEIEKQKRDNQIRRAELWKARYNERIKQDKADKEAGKQKQNEKKLVGDIEKNIKWLSDRLRPETRSKDNAIPEQFRSALAGLLAEFDLQSKGSKKIEKKKGYPSKTTLKLKQLRDQYAAIAKENDDDGNNVFRYNGDLLVKMDELIKAMEGLDKFFDKRYGREVTIADLSLSEMFIIDTMLKSLVHQFREYKNVTIESKRAEIAGVSSEVIGDMDTQVNRHGAAREGGALGKVNGLLNMAEVTPIYFFKRLGAMYKMYRELRRGFDKYIENDREVIKRLSKIMSGYYNKKNPGTTIESWRTMEDAQTFNFEYGTVTLSVAQMMEVYLYANRPQAFGHMIGDGIIVTPISPVGKIETAKEKLLGHEPMVDPVRLTYENVQEIISKLSEEQVDMANKLQKLVAGYMSDLGNETTMKLYGYKMFDDPNYFGIHVSQTATNSNVDAPAITETIKNFGWTKPLTPGAKNTIVIGDIFTDVARYCNEMNQFNAYAVPVSDFMRVYNYNLRDEDGTLKGSAKSAIIKAFGKQAHTYIMNFLRDLNGASMRRNGGLEGMIDSALGRAKKAAVFMNMRVALQQPTAIVRALAQINARYFVGVRPSRKATQEMIEHCPIAQWKAWGFYDTHFGRDVEDLIMNNWSKADVIGSALYGALDNMTWGMIWQAVKKEVEKKQPALEKGSPAYWEACNRRASEVFDSTQVVDSPFHRSDAMRSKDTLVKQFTSFQGEPTLSFNVVRDFVVQAYDAVADGDKSKAVKLIAKGVEIWTLQAAVVAVAQSLWDAVRHKDPDGDDDEDEGFLELWWQNFMADFVDDLKFYNNIYFLKEFTPYAEKLVDYMKTGKWDTYDSNKLLMFQGAEKMTQGMQQFIKKLQKGDEYKHKNGEPYTWYEVMTNFLGGIGYLTGMPIGTVMRDAQSILKWFHINAFAADGTEEKTKPGLMDAIANKMGYRPIGSGSSETTATESKAEKKSEKKAETSGHEAELQNYREGLSDNYSEEQKDKLVKQYEKKLDKESEAASYEGDDFQGHIREGLTNFEYEMEKRSLKAAENAAGLSGNAKNDALWDVISEGYTKSVASGNMGTIWAMREAFEANGGDVDWFDAKITDKMKSEYKKTIGNDPSEAPGSLARQETMRNYMIEHGVTDDEISEIVRKTYTASDLKAAMRMGNEEYIMDELVPLVQAGLTRADFEYLYKYRNYGAKYYNGKYSDPQYKASTGTYVWPTQGTITSMFGYRSAASTNGVGTTDHPAIDIGAPMGSEVVAADGGVIISAGWAGGYGNQVAIKHDDGTITYYSHLSGWNVKVGDQVSQGQQIAQVGSTGNSTGPHLDFKVEKDGEPVDPLQFLDKTNAKYNLDA